MRRGEIVALLGPNGAGKTTTLEILEGFRRRDGGPSASSGLTRPTGPPARELRERTGLVLQDIAVEPYLTLRETLARQAGYYAQAAVGGRGHRPDRAGRAGAAQGQDLLGGQKRRLDLALGLIGNPELLFLDEPTTGFDAAARRDAWQLVRDLRAAGTTILLTTHDMDEAQALADRVVVLAGGLSWRPGPPSAIGGRDAERARITFLLNNGYTAADLPLPAGRPGRGGRGGGRRPHPGPARLTGWAVRHDTPLAGLTVDRPSLEDVYLRLTHDGALAGEPERTTR